MIGLAALVLAPGSLLVGGWDLTVSGKDWVAPSWLEVRKSGNRTLVGRFVGAFGSARPVGEIVSDADGVQFSIPVQWEGGSEPIRFRGKVDGERLTGVLEGPFFGGASVVGVRAPRLATPARVSWGRSVSLTSKEGLDAWQPARGWACHDGILTNEHPGANLVSRTKFGDFWLHTEFRIPKGSNSGIYLRGRYEVQIDDAFGEEPDDLHLGAIYGFLVPRFNAARPAGAWQTLDVTLLGRRVTVVLNGTTVIDRQEIPGITGGALDSLEGEPGPIMLQGDHGRVEFRRFTVTPASPK